jgi:hypothetical protein
MSVCNCNKMAILYDYLVGRPNMEEFHISLFREIPEAFLSLLVRKRIFKLR